MNSEQPIFRNTSQALHVSYLMQVLPVGTPSWMQKMIDDHMKACGVWDEPKAYERTINFSGMSPLDIRAECANVTKRVDERLKTNEAGAIKAWYGHQKTKEEGVQAVYEYVLPLFDCDPRAVKAIVWSLYAPSAVGAGLTVRDIAKEYELAKSGVGRRKMEIKKIAHDVLQRGVAEIEQVLSIGKIIDPI